MGYLLALGGSVNYSNIQWEYPMGRLRELLHILSSYIDDIFMSGDSELDCIQALVDTINLLLGLGFTLHPDKCQFIPSTKDPWLYN